MLADRSHMDPEVDDYIARSEKWPEEIIQAKTREARIDEYVDKILVGKGFRDR